VEFDYVVVGSGAGGGTVAARLAERGASVVVLEAGGDPRDFVPCNYDVPAFHVLECENDGVKWDYYVSHYRGHDANVLYPRARTLGGCTAHNAMIFVYPHDEDWDAIAELTCDQSWSAKQMRRYFERVENCSYRPLQRFLSTFGINPSRHGFRGWLRTELPRLSLLESLDVLEPLWREIALEYATDPEKIRTLRWIAEAGLDANDWRLVTQNAGGIRSVPLTTDRHRRVGARERLLAVARRSGERLRIELGALATRVLFEKARAAGVEYLRSGEKQTVRARREVVLAGGAFNTPQLLMLSGIGPPDHLRAMGIDVRIALEGVGSNLQDRYEIGVVNRLNRPWPFFRGATFSPGDAQYEQWSGRDPCGVYTTNGAALSLARCSSVAGGIPDLFCMLLLADFHGYYPGFSRGITQKLDYMTWVVLKAHTRNRAGTVRLRSRDPCDPPEINFNYFEEGGDADLRAMVEGVNHVRALGKPLRESGIIEEELPGPEYDTDEKLGAFIRANAWGHHASCTCAIGSATSGGVLSGDFRVHGVEGLRVVDASVFPRIPGFFIASATYMIAEKAAGVMLSA
jgi:choline dehydrogenase